MRILAIDPGETNGWAVLDNTEGTVVTNELSGWKDLEMLLDQVKPTHIVAEAFRLYPGKAAVMGGSNLQTVRTLGVLQFLAWRREIPYKEQSAADAKFIRLSESARLETCKGSLHKADALRHAFLFLIRCKGPYDNMLNYLQRDPEK